MNTAVHALCRQNKLLDAHKNGAVVIVNRFSRGGWTWIGVQNDTYMIFSKIYEIILHSTKLIPREPMYVIYVCNVHHVHVCTNWYVCMY